METLHKVIQKRGLTSGEHIYEKVSRYYDIAGPDYSAWSSRYNMHFGYLEKFHDFFSLERMLDNMSRRVLEELHISSFTDTHLADLGCGVGTVACYAAKAYPGVQVTGVTISDYQVDKGTLLSREENAESGVRIVKSNFEELDFPDEHFTHAYALESACHARGDNKALFISEMSRVLKKGGRFSIADGFIRHSGTRPALFNKMYRKVLNYWALPSFATLPEFVHCLGNNRFINISVREISMRIAPSVAWVPWTCLKFFAKELWKNKSLRMEKERWYNVYGPLLGMLLGLYRKHFGYYIISGEKSRW